jgi:hypothetical protein
VAAVRDLLRRSPRAGYDVAREQLAEQRAAELLRSCVSERDWETYSELGFIAVAGVDDRYAYLVYPYKPIVAYVPATGELLGEYCVAFADDSKPFGSARLPASDDVLAKWLALTSDERGLIGAANVHAPGRLTDPACVARDLRRLRAFDRRRDPQLT